MSLELSSQSLRLPATPRHRILERLLGGDDPAAITGSLEILLPDGCILRRGGANPGPAARLQIVHWRALRRIAFAGAVGFAEAYMDGDIAMASPHAVIAFALANEGAFGGRLRGNRLARFAGRFAHALRANTRRGSRRNIAAHYDLGNDFYRLWLDETMSYSAAVFAEAHESLETAQRRKYRRVAALAGIRPGMRVLEIGCGWGGFAAFAAGELGCSVVGLTLSTEQKRFAEARLKEQGLSDRVEIRLQDYRDCRETFDAAVSIEMFEAVGESNWPVYFSGLRDRLRSGGRAALQIITIAEDRFAHYRRTADFIQRYIFPGGMLPTESAVLHQAGRAGLAVDSVFRFGGDYARTLLAWNKTFQARWSQVRELGFDERFRRMWGYYLDYCAAGFEHKTIDVAHFALVRR